MTSLVEQDDHANSQRCRTYAVRCFSEYLRSSKKKYINNHILIIIIEILINIFYLY